MVVCWRGSGWLAFCLPAGSGRVGRVRLPHSCSALILDTLSLQHLQVEEVRRMDYEDNDDEFLYGSAAKRPKLDSMYCE